MKRFMGVSCVICSFITLSLFGVQMQKTLCVNAQVKDQTDTLAIPADTSDREDEAQLAKLKRLQQQYQEEAKEEAKI